MKITLQKQSCQLQYWRHYKCSAKLQTLRETVKSQKNLIKGHMSKI